MNKFYTIKYLLLLFISIVLGACNDDDRAKLDLSEVDIKSFSVNGFAGIINESKARIDLELPRATDLTKLTPKIEVSAGAEVTPASNSVVDLSSPLVYRVTNGNLYDDYTVYAYHTRAIETFNIGKYIGVIDHTKGTIQIKVSLTDDITSITPQIELKKEAIISPSIDSKQDFSKPVTYIVKYKEEVLPYKVTVEKVNFKPIGFLSVAESENEISDYDEKTAYEWFKKNVPSGKFVSFADIKNSKVNLNEYALLWWHNDSQKSLPVLALDPSVTSKLKIFNLSGGAFFFSSWAVQYVSELGIAKDGKAVNNIWGDTNTPFVIGDDWGLCFKGQENHPVFAGLQTLSGNKSKAYLLSSGVKAKAHNAIWNFEWGDYAHDIPKWTKENGAINLASFHWDDNMTGRSVMFEYAKNGTSGGTICIGVEAYDWYNEDGSIPNTYKSNLELMTSNIINYLIK
jgi:hypothetical protein